MTAEDQAIEFFVKRAEYAADLAIQHCRNMEFDKGSTLYKQAFVYYKKAEKALPENPEIKQKLGEIKIKYQEAMRNMAQ